MTNNVSAIKMSKFHEIVHTDPSPIPFIFCAKIFVSLIYIYSSLPKNIEQIINFELTLSKIQSLVSTLKRRRQMTYADKFVVEVKQGGKILRVKDGAVYLPFGSEYSIYLKNLNSKRANVNISIDGEDVLDNHSLILDANSSTELQGFLRGNVAKNRFRFIHKLANIGEIVQMMVWLE